MTPAAFERQSKKRLRGMFDSIEHPDIAVELVPVASEESRRPQDVGVTWRQLVSGQHLSHHLVVARVTVQRFDNPIAPSPDVPLAVPNLIDRPAPVPIAVAPDIHP